MRDLRLTGKERRQAGRARDELEVHIKEVLIEDARFLGDVRREEVGQDVAVGHDDLRAARLRRPATGEHLRGARRRLRPGTRCEQKHAREKARERPCHRAG